MAGKGIKPIGYLTWFSVPDESVGLRKLKQALALQGLNPALAPSDQKAINVFKRAMREQEGRHKNGTITETTVTLVNETPEDCVYQISRVVRDLDEREVDFPKELRVVFNKRTEEISFNVLDKTKRSEVMSMMEAIQDFYDKNGSKVTGSKVRGIVRKYLKSEPDETRNIDGLSGENLRGKAGGIYFIPAQHIDSLTSLSTALTELYSGRAYLHAVPLADGASEREIIRRHHVANARQEILEAMGEVKGLLSADRERAPRSDVIAGQWSRFKAIERRAKKYADLLSEEQEEIAEMGQILRAQLGKLLGD